MLLRLARTFLLLFVVVATSRARAIGPFIVPDFRISSLPQDVGADAGPQSVVLADVNKDGRDDLIAINRLEESTKVLIRLAGEDGTFQDPPTEVDVFLEEEFMVPVALAVGDVGSPFIGPQEGNADGNPDVVVATEDGYVVVMTGDGDGGFQVREESIDLLIEGRGVSLADVDDDGDVDIAAVDEDTLYIFLNEGFAFNVDDAEEYDLDNEVDAIDVATGDFDGDGDVDVVALNPEDRTLSVLHGDGTGLFTDAELKLSTVVDSNEEDQVPGDFAVADLDEDSIDDVVVINFGDFTDQQVLVLSSALQDRSGLSGPFAGTGVALANFDEDDHIDAILLSQSEGASFLVGDGSRSGFADISPLPIGGVNDGRAIAAGDIDGDDKPDFVVLDVAGTRIEVAINQGVVVPTPTPTATPTVADPTATTTATATTRGSTPTPTGTSTPPPTSTVSPMSSPTETSAPATSTPLKITGVDDDGCAVTTTGARPIPLAVWIMPVAAFLWKRRR
jgi:hypothetical protein